MELHACYFKDLDAFSTDQRWASATAGKTGTRATGQRNWPTHPAVPPGTDDQNSTPARELEPPQPLLRSLDGGQHPCAKIGVRRRTGHFGRAERDQLAQADRERRQRRPPAECTADRRHHDPLDPNDEGSTADQVPPGTGSRPAAAHEMPGTCRSTMTPPGIGATRADVTGMVPSTLLKWWCPYTPMCMGVSSAKASSRSRSRPTVIAVTAESTAESTTMVVITRLHRCSHRHTRRALSGRGEGGLRAVDYHSSRDRGTQMPPIAELGVVDAPPRRRSAAPARPSGVTHRQPSEFRRCGVRPPGR